MTLDKIWSNLYRKIKPECKRAFFGALIIGLFAHLFAMTNNLLTFDSMWNIYSDQDMITSGRQFLTYACSIGSYYDLPLINGVLSIIYLAIASALITDVFHIEGKVLPVITGGLLVTFPSVASTFAYSYTIDGYMLAVLLAVMAYYFSEKYKFGFIGGIFCLGISIGIYQAEFSFTILLCIFGLMLDVLIGEKAKTLLIKMGKYLTMGIGGYAFYFISLKIMLSLKGTAISGYQGTDRINTFSLSELPVGIKAAFDNFTYFARYGGCFSTTPVMKLSYLVFMALGIVSFVYLFIKRKSYKKPHNIAFLMALWLCVPFGTCLITILSPDTTFHLLMRMPWVVIMIFFVALLSQFNKEVALKFETIVACGSVIMAFIFILQSAVAANVAYFNLNERYEKTYALSVRIIDRIEQTEGYKPGMPVAILGGFPDEAIYPHTDITKDDLSGYFGVDGDFVCNSSGSYQTFMERYLSFSFPILTLDEEIKLSETPEFAEMGKFPAKESIEIINDVLVVKLNG